MSESPVERAPLGHPAEAEVPQHTADPDADAPEQAMEDSVAYETAVEDGAPLPPGDAPGDGPAPEDSPEFRGPGE